MNKICSHMKLYLSLKIFEFHLHCTTKILKPFNNIFYESYEMEFVVLAHNNIRVLYCIYYCHNSYNISLSKI